MAIFHRRRLPVEWMTRQVDPAEFEAAAEAKAALRRSQHSVVAEQERLRTSQEIAADIRNQREENHFTERIALSFQLRLKGN